jgi:hypothetical protein
MIERSQRQAAPQSEAGGAVLQKSNELRLDFLGQFLRAA